MSSHELVELFEAIRDIPYRIPLSVSESDDCCSGKHRRLKARLDALGIQTRWQVCSFRWRSTPLPDRVLAIPHMDESTHVFLRVLFEGEWIDLDATWDAGIGAVLPVNTWSGRTSTDIAVPVIERFSVEKSHEIMEHETADEIVNDLATNGPFHEALNTWLAEVRKGSSR